MITSASRIASRMSCVSRDSRRNLRQFRRQQRGRPAQHDIDAELGEQVDVGACHAAVCDVADDGHAQPLQRGAGIEDGARVQKRLRGMLVGAVARVDDGMGRWRARKWGAPEAAWRITMASGRMAARVLSVSTSDSPLLTLEPEAVMPIASAPRRLAAISKLVRVRVDASKNRLTIMRPFRMSSRLKDWFCIGW